MKSESFGRPGPTAIHYDPQKKTGIKRMRRPFPPPPSPYPRSAASKCNRPLKAKFAPLHCQNIIFIRWFVLAETPTGPGGIGSARPKVQNRGRTDEEEVTFLLLPLSLSLSPSLFPPSLLRSLGHKRISSPIIFCRKSGKRSEGRGGGPTEKARQRAQWPVLSPDTSTRVRPPVGLLVGLPLPASTGRKKGKRFGRAQRQ